MYSSKTKQHRYWHWKTCFRIGFSYIERKVAFVDFCRPDSTRLDKTWLDLTRLWVIFCRLWVTFGRLDLTRLSRHDFVRRADSTIGGLWMGEDSTARRRGDSPGHPGFSNRTELNPWKFPKGTPRTHQKFNRNLISCWDRFCPPNGSSLTTKSIPKQIKKQLWTQIVKAQRVLSMLVAEMNPWAIEKHWLF